MTSAVSTLDLQSNNGFARVWDEMIRPFPEPFILTDPDSIIQSVNPSFCNVFGYQTKDIAGQSTRKLYAFSWQGIRMM